MKNLSYFAYSTALLLCCNQSLPAEVIPASIHSVSSQSPVPDRDAVNTINGSGLNPNGEHAASENGIVWTTIGTGGAKDLAPFIVYDLGSPQDVNRMHVWNYNGSGMVTKIRNNAEASQRTPRPFSVIGAKDVEIFTSKDGKQFTSRGMKQFAMASGQADYKGERIELNYEDVRYIKIAIKSTYEDTIFDGTQNRPGDFEDRMLTGLSEVRFEGLSLVQITAPQKTELIEGSGDSLSYKVKLNERPAGGSVVQVVAVPEDKTLRIGDENPGSAKTLNFDGSNWNQWQEVVVSSVDDDIDTVNFKTKINHFIKKNRDADYTKISDNVEISIKDNDETPIEELAPIDPEKRMEWFADIKYYWFIHWNPSALAGTEISWSRAAVGRDKYDSLYKEFNPTEFDADEWVRIAKAAGLRTIVAITKHHDGFCMWNTKTTDYNIMNTPFKRDVIKELSEACKKQGMRFSLYFSTPDAYNPDWWAPIIGGPSKPLPPGKNGQDAYEFSQYSQAGPGSLPAGQKPNHKRFLKYMNEQVEELLTNYGDISLMWWDGSNPTCFGKIWDQDNCKIGKDLEGLARKLQPAMVQSNRVGYWKDGHWWTDEFGDYNSTEMGFSKVDFTKPWELTWTLGTQWSWRANDSYKSKAELIRDYILKTTGQNGNFLMNVSPDASGAFEPLVVNRLIDIGNWLKLYSETIYGTRGGPYLPANPDVATWGYSTRKGNKVFLHILNWPSSNQITLPALGQKVVKSSLLSGGEVKVTQESLSSTITVEVPDYYQKEISTVIELEMNEDVMDVPMTKVP